MSPEDIQAIDVHTHFGRYENPQTPSMTQFCSASPAEIVRRARLAQTVLSVASPLRALMPRGHGDPLAGNQEAAEAVAQTEGLLQWVVVDPLKPATYAQAAEMLRQPRCMGIKLHPEEHRYRISDHGEALFSFAAEHDALLQSHSGDANSMPEDFLPFADAFPEVRLIISHLGNGADGDLTHQVRALSASRHGNLWTDTSSSNSVIPGLIEWAVAEVGAERILFGSDSPCYYTPMQRARVNTAEISDEAKRALLRDNAISLLPIPGELLDCRRETVT